VEFPHEENFLVNNAQKENQTEIFQRVGPMLLLLLLYDCGSK
jgi:hypothetical protein